MSDSVPTAIHEVRGYSLFADKGVPYAMRQWTSYATDAKGNRTTKHNEMRLELTPENFTGGAQAKEVYDALAQAWREWREWQQANGKE